MMFLIQFIVAMLATIAFSILFTAPRKEILFCGFTGALGWIVYYELVRIGMSDVISSAIATLILTIFSRAFAVIRKNPGTVYLLPGIFPLVPGAGIYYTAYYLFTGNQELFSSKGLNTFEIAAAIVFGIIFGYAIPQGLFNKLART
jgi:uncharacterized membrane protein YjjB (DUF3815 family)